jgi:DNA gyrase/topoisomerase IV subunit A
MKKGWKIAGAVAGLAALAALLPHSCIKDEEDDKLTVQALLWKYTNQPDHETPGNRKISIDIGFHNPFAVETDDLLMDDEDDLILISNDGVIIRIRVSDVNVMSRYASGVRIMRLVNEDSRLVSFARADHDEEEEVSEVEAPDPEEEIVVPVEEDEDDEPIEEDEVEEEASEE